MRNSLVLWLVSGAVSVAVHAGALAALSYIPLPASKNNAHTDLQVASASLDNLFQSQISSIPPPAATRSAMSAEAVESQAQTSERIAAATDKAVSAVRAASVERVPSPSLGAEKPSSTRPVEPASTLGPYVAAEAPVGTYGALTPMAGSEAQVTQSEALVPLATASELDPTGLGAMVTPEAPAAEQSSPQVGETDSRKIVAVATSPAISSRPGSQPVVSAWQERPVLSEPSPLESMSAAGLPPKEVAALPSATFTTPEASASPDTVLAPEVPLPVHPAAPQPVLPVHDRTETANAMAVGTAVLTQAERVRKFLEQDGDRPCVYAKPGNVEADRPNFTGFGGGRVRIHQFSEDFRRAVGVGPRLAMRPVMDAQCPAVDFIRSLRSLGATELAIIIDHQEIANFANLIGHLEGKFDVHILLLLIDDDGAVQDISGKLHRKGKVNVFAEPVRLRAQGRSRYQMLLAISTSSPLVPGATLTPGEAQQVFERLAAQTVGQNRITSWGISSFRVE